MNYEQSNVGLGMVPHKRNCRCDECRIEKQQQRIRELEDALLDVKAGSDEPHILQIAKEALEK